MTQGNQNGHHPEEAQQITGYRQGPAVPSIHDLAMTGEGGGYGPGFNLAKEFITGSTLPEEYYPRGVYTAQRIARRVRLVAKDYRVRKRKGCNLPGSLWVGDQMNIALDGEGRKDAIRALQAMAHIQSNEDERRGFLNSLRRPGPQG